MSDSATQSARAACKPARSFCKDSRARPARYRLNHPQASGWSMAHLAGLVCLSPWDRTGITASRPLPRAIHGVGTRHPCSLAGTCLAGRGGLALQGRACVCVQLGQRESPPTAELRTLIAVRRRVCGCTHSPARSFRPTTLHYTNTYSNSTVTFDPPNVTGRNIPRGSGGGIHA